ncbi:hypothetical protein E2C01_052620 [Portunus trituberculatus]|uniref:Uncharacterized protein n=1 Tax=Portunus trituberculatus TaxID=210409 RepID=A0A5B7GM98_PORTR|nr:hypothetical protein [Portunus trituberculatus]
MVTARPLPPASGIRQHGKSNFVGANNNNNNNKKNNDEDDEDNNNNKKKTGEGEGEGVRVWGGAERAG